MTTIQASQFKTKCLSIMDRIHDGGESVLVTRRGEPLVRVIPVTERTGKTRPLGALMGEVLSKEDLVHISFADDWEGLK